jgi:hypothetical protein
MSGRSGGDTDGGESPSPLLGSVVRLPSGRGTHRERLCIGRSTRTADLAKERALAD